MNEIVVGVDGSLVAEQALRWAVEEARLRGMSVRAVLAWPPDAVEQSVAPMSRHDLEASAAQVLHDAVRRVTTGDQLASVRSTIVFTSPVEGLLQESRDAAMLVVGARGRGTFARLQVGSGSHAWVPRTTVPVVVVPHLPDGDAAGPVVVGVDGSESSIAALRWAAEEARARKATLRVLHAWQVMYAADELPSETAARRVLNTSLQAGLGQEPSVDLDADVVPGLASVVLLGAARQAQLLAVGTGGDGGFAGSTSRRCLQRAPCPVAIVRTRQD